MPPPNKRRRLTLACSSCRQRKSRCSGDRPCSLCEELGCECVYQEIGATSNLTVGKSYIAQLEQRLHNIESSIRQLQQDRNISPQAPVASQRSNEASSADENGSEVRPGPNAAHRNASEIGEIDGTENAIDGMGAINFTDEEDCGFFGPSSNIAFMRHISRAIAQGNACVPAVSPPNQKGGGMVNVSKSRPPSVGPQRRARTAATANGVNIFALPPEDRTWSLIRQYFHKTGQLLPFIHESSFCETYFQMKRDNLTKVRRTWLGLLNIVLAIATSLSTDDMPAEKRIEESDVYYQRANGLCDRDSKRNASLEMVQYLLILGQYLQGTQKSVQAWTTHGLAISAAFQLGLHSPDANRGFSPLECEIRKRTWFGCILLDRTLSMTFGRPCTIPESYVKLDMPLKDMQMLSYTQETDVHPQLDGIFFTAAIKLYVVMYNVLDTCYGQNLGFESSLTTVDAISRILEGERQLDEWRLQLLPTLGLQVWHKPMGPDDVQQMSPDSVIRNRFNIVLTVRYHNLRILLYRKSLESFLSAYGGNDEANQDKRLMQQVGVTSIQNCVESAIAIISMVHTITLSTGWRRELLGAWNYSLYYTFNAGLIIFGAFLVSSKERVHDPSAWSIVDHSRPYLDMAADALQRLDSGNRVIERCVEYLSQLSLILNSNITEPNFNGNNTNNGIANPNFPEYAPDLSIHGAVDSNPGSLPHMDLGEFMIDSDLDFLSRMFNLNRNVEANEWTGN